MDQRQNLCRFSRAALVHPQVGEARIQGSAIAGSQEPWSADLFSALPLSGHFGRTRFAPHAAFPKCQWRNGNTDQGRRANITPPTAFPTKAAEGSTRGQTPVERESEQVQRALSRKQPGFNMNTFEGANQAIPMKTLVIYCFDPRAAEIPRAVSDYFGDEVYPGENILDQSGNRVGHTRTLFTETNAGGRAAFALESVAAMDYIFSVQNVVVVHHSFCGTTTLTPELLVEEFHDHHHADISTMFDQDSLAIMDFEKSIRYDIALLRSSPAVPKHVKLYGFFYEISSGGLTEVVRDIPE